MKKISENIIRRLPKYLRYLSNLDSIGINRVSSAELGRALGYTPSQVRQDLSTFGGFGLQGYGYDVQNLYREIKAILGVGPDYHAVLVGCGGIGQSLLHHVDFQSYGISMDAAFDATVDCVGKIINGVTVYPAEIMGTYLEEHDIDIAVLTVPRNKGVQVATVLVHSGIKAIWNFTNEDVVSPDSDVIVENIHLSDSLLTMTYYLGEKNEKTARKQKVAI